MTEIDPIENLQRRKFIRQTALTSAGLTLAPALISSAKTNAATMDLKNKSKGRATSETKELQTDEFNDLSKMDIPSKKITIQAGGKSFTATLLDNEAAEKFYSLLPLSVDMTDLNRNEKYYRLAENLPTNSSNPGTIRNGDLMLWGANTVVIFYETFPTTYSYTPLGKIDDPAGLKAALSAGSVIVSFTFSNKKS